MACTRTFKETSSGAEYPSSAMSDQASMPSAQQLDFYQAMKDFRLMFPDMDEEIIEAVLRTNNGAVDSTIDQLLTMNVDLDAKPENTVPKSYQAYVDQGISPEVLDSSSSSDEADMAPPYPPPSYTDYTKSLQPLPCSKSQSHTAPVARAKATDLSRYGDHTTPKLCGYSNTSDRKRNSLSLGHIANSSQTASKHVIPDLLCDDLPTLPPPPPPLPPQMPVLNHDYTQLQKIVPKRVQRNWNPPLLGDLPDDFLRISVSPSSCERTSLSASSSPGGRSYGEKLSRRCHSETESSPRLPKQQSLPSQRTPRRFLRRTRETRHDSLTTDSELNSNMIQQKMVENQRRRSETAVPEMIQILEDERLALILQNSEFLSELRQDEDFMKTLEKDHMNATAFEPPLESPELDPNRPKSSQMEGYGDDLDMNLSAFPFDRTLPKDENAEFRKQLNHMGGSSRKKFAAAARKFFSKKKKKSPKQMYPYYIPDLFPDQKPGYQILQNSDTSSV